MNPARTLRTGLALLAVHGAAIATQVAPTPVPAQHGEEAGILPGMEDRSSLDAYLLLKDRGLEIPLELALQVNASMTVNPADPADRQAGGSPGTAWPIPDTAHGDTFQDSGSTIPLSNFIQELVAFTGSCFQDANLAGNDAWYTFTLAQPTRVQATTCGGVIAFDTELAVLTTGLDPVAINDDFCGYFTPHFHDRLLPGPGHLLPGGGRLRRFLRAL